MRGSRKRSFTGARAPLLSIRRRPARVRPHDGLIGIADVRRSGFKANQVGGVPAVSGPDAMRVAVIRSGIADGPESV